MTDSDVPTSETARATYDEAVHMRPHPDPSIGRNSTNMPLPQAVEVHHVADLGTAHRPNPLFGDVLDRRRSQRTFTPLTASDLVHVLKTVFALRGFAVADDGGTRRFRPVPSAGARQPLVPLVLTNNCTGLARGLWRYDPDGHRLLLIETTHDDRPEPDVLRSAWLAVCEAGAFATRPPAVIVLAAQFDATLARYPGGAALVWRDAGVALGMLHLAATAADLASCILGTAGVLDEKALNTCAVRGTLVGDVGCLALGNPA